jgi:hypothetical protein
VQIGAGHGDRRRDDQREILLEAVGEDRGPRLDVEHRETRARVGVAHGQIDRARDAAVRLGEHGAKVVAEVLQREGDGLFDLAVDAGELVGQDEARIGRADVHGDALELHGVGRADDGLGLDAKVERQVHGLQGQGDVRQHLRRQRDAALPKGDLERASLPRVAPVGAQQRERALAGARGGVVERAPEPRGRDGDVNDDARGRRVRDRRPLGRGRARGIHRPEAGAPSEQGGGRGERGERAKSGEAVGGQESHASVDDAP